MRFKKKHGKDCQYEEVEASTAKSNGKPPPGDKTLGIEPYINFSQIENGNENE